MSWPTIVMWYDNIVKDPSLLLLFPEKEWMSIQELLLLGGLHFQHYFREAFCLHIIPYNVGEGQNGIHHQQWPKNKLGSHLNSDLGYRWGWGRNLGMVTTCCHHDQSKMEASDALSALCQCNVSEPSVVVVRRRYTNTPYIPQGSCHLLYLNVSTFSGGASSTQFPLEQLCLCRLFPFTDADVVLPQEEGEMGLKVFPHFQEALWQRSEKEHHLSEPISLLVPLSAPHPHQEEGTQMERVSVFYPALRLLQDINQVTGQLECEVVQETEELAWRYDNRQIKQARRHKRWQAWMAKQTDATFQEIFSQVSLANSIMFLPGCVSSAVPLCYMSKALATATQQGKDVPATTTESEPEGSPALGPSSSPAYPPRTLPLPNTSFTEYPLCCSHKEKVGQLS